MADSHRIATPPRRHGNSSASGTPTTCSLRTTDRTEDETSGQRRDNGSAPAVEGAAVAGRVAFSRLFCSASNRGVAAISRTDETHKRHDDSPHAQLYIGTSPPAGDLEAHETGLCYRAVPAVPNRPLMVPTPLLLCRPADVDAQLPLRGLIDEKEQRHVRALGLAKNDSASSLRKTLSSRASVAVAQRT